MANQPFNRFWNELKRRNVPRVATVYAISSWVIIQVATTVFPYLQIPGWVTTALIILIMVGFPIVLILAWIFEFAPQAEQEVQQQRVDSPYPNRRLFTSNVGIAILLLLLIAQFLYFKFSDRSKNSEGVHSIAVMPFDNLTNDKEIEPFGVGITSEIISHLSKIGTLEVSSRTSVQLLKKAQASIGEIASKLSVNYVLSGSIRKSGQKIRITVELVDAITDKTVLSDDYDYLELKDIFHVQSDVSAKVAQALKAKLTPEEKVSLAKNYTDNIQAYKYYLKGRNFWDKRTSLDFDSAETNFKKAIDIDPQYALAYSGLADCYTFNQKGLTQIEAIPIARDYTLKALSIDSNLCEAVTTMGFIQSHYDFDWKKGKETLEKAILINPNYELAHRYLGNVLLFTGHIEEGLTETKKALALDPLAVSVNMVLGRNYYLARKYDEALAQIKKTLALNPKFISAYAVLGSCYLQRNQLDLALTAFLKQPMGEYDAGTVGRCFVVNAFARSNKRIRAKEEWNKITDDEKQKSPVFMAIALTGLGKNEEALTYLEHAVDIHALALILTNMNPEFDPLRNDPRFQAILKRLNFK
jgi:TolB-like protein/Tfp pilus assembly protein PilF